MAGLIRDEKSVFTSFSSRIIRSINFRVLVPKAFSISLIGDWERADCLTKKDHPYEMGDKFVGIMNMKISASPTNFYIFVHLLKSLGEAERALAREMEAAVGVYRAEDRIPAATLQEMNLALGAGTQTTAGSGPPPPPPPHTVSPPAGLTTIAADAKPTLQELQYMSYTSEDGQTVHFRLMDRIKPRVTRLAVALKFPDYVIDDMETKRDPVFYLLKEWLRGGNQEHDSRPLTWGTLITALRAAGLSEEADILEQYFVAAPTQVAVRGAAAIGVRAGRVIQTDSSDPPPPVGSPAGGITRVPGSVAGQDPSWPLLISIKKPDGGALRIKDAIVDFHDKDQCIQFAHILLKSRQDVMRIVNDRSKREKKDFVRAVLDKWLSSGSSSWQQLVDSMRDADMDETATDEIAKYVL